MTKVLITGAAGYLAGFIIERLRLQYELTLTDWVKPRSDFKGLPFVPGDITSYTDV
ncbi:NAD(P)-dependent oxidoreductase, partial [Candidatus Poribacteria bacterium]|nr:NAD(P)-dependent oxidoreductase [Candidatus Poribacteria bacterium]